ncbi:MAG: phage terminase large subunit [Alphaproteobacteria bacterium]
MSPKTNPISDAELKALYRNDFEAFATRAFEIVNPGKTYQENWHLEMLCWLLTRARNGQERRLIINLCPRSLKSFIASVAFPAWCLGNDPTMRFICCSYSMTLAETFHRQFLSIVSSSWFIKTFPKFRPGDKVTQTELTTRSEGYRFATSVGGTLTGRGGEFIIIDDPLDSQGAMSEADRNRVNNWYSSSVPSRLDDPKSASIIIVSQRIHENDLTGYVETIGSWNKVSVPAIATEDCEVQVNDTEIVERRKGEPMHNSRMGLDELAEVKKALGSANFEAQYQQSPMPFTGNLIELKWFNRYPFTRSFKYDQIVQSWDTASEEGIKNSYSVCTTWGKSNKCWLLLDVYRHQHNYPALLKRAKQLAHDYKVHRILVEKANSGHALGQQLHDELQVAVALVPPRGDKISRLETGSALIEAGRIFLPDEAPWLAEFLKEVLTFPNGKYDDQVDSLSQFLNWVWLTERGRPHKDGAPVERVLPPGFTVHDRYSQRTGQSVFASLFNGHSW